MTPEKERSAKGEVEEPKKVREPYEAPELVEFDVVSVTSGISGVAATDGPFYS